MYNDDAFNSDLDSPVEESTGMTTPFINLIILVLIIWKPQTIQ